MPDRILETKFHKPPWHSNGVIRPRLLDQLQAGFIEQRKLTLVSAPAGYGKTTLIAGWLHALPEHTQSVWLCMEKSDNEPARFLSYWASAWDRIVELTLEDIQALLELPQLPPYQSILDEIINALARSEEPAILVLDDYHTITNPVIHEMLEYFIEHQPRQVHLVLITRSDPLLPLARLRARGQMVEIRANDLRFTEEEARHFFDQSIQLPLDGSAVRSLEMFTEGWAVGLHLAALALQNRSNPNKIVESFSGSHRYIYDYLAEEVINQQSSEVREFLIQTSILERFNAETCQAVTGQPNCQGLLSQLEQANLFLIPLDDERVWYRYHHLFADFLRTELANSKAEELNKRAAFWYEQNELITEAVQYASASGDPEFLADVIDRGLRKESIWSAGNLTLYSSWLEVLPPQVFQRRPELSLNASHILYLSGRFDLAEKQIDQTEKTLQSLPASCETAHILALASLYRGEIASARGKTQQAIEEITAAQKQLPQEDHLPHARGFFSLGLAYELAGQTELAVQNYMESSEEAQSTGELYLAIHALCSAAQVQIIHGRLYLAEQTCQKAIQIAKGKRLPPLGLAESILGIIALERNELSTAEGFLQNGLALSRRGGLKDDIVLGLSYLARLHVYQGRESSAFTAAQEANSIMQGFNLERMSMIAAAFTAHLQLNTGHLQAAAQWAAEYQAVRADWQNDLADLILVHVLLMTGDLDNVLPILDHLLNQAREQNHVRTCIEAMILLALFHRAQKDIPTAADWLSQALQLAAAENFIRIFIDDGEALLELLLKARQTAPELVDAILDTIQAKRDPSPSPLDQLFDPLSEQEKRVLKLIVAGKSNQEIADELVISVGTAKWHVHNILQKMGTGSRSQLIICAKELGL